MNGNKISLPSLMFLSRWLQAPLYFGLIVVMCVYVYHFIMGLIALVIGVNKFDSVGIVLQALDLIDVVMIANLIIMVVLGGYQTFVSRLGLQDHPDCPEWLEGVNAGTLKIKLALALVTISSIHLLRTFMDPAHTDFYSAMWQVIIHITLVMSAIAIAFTDKLMMWGHE